jgi:ABC-2 type transport system ATP-binding protein
MRQTADRLIVLGRGRLIADTSVAELAEAGGGSLEDAYVRLTREAVEFQ